VKPEILMQGREKTIKKNFFFFLGGGRGGGGANNKILGVNFIKKYKF
jgi:hypothetical protein